VLQDDVFTRFEADRWFERNRKALQEYSPEHDMPSKLIQFYDLQPKSVVEIGAANGARLAALRGSCSSRVVAVELSAEAIEDGKLRFPSVIFVRAAASALPLHETFDLVIVNFVFHWIDRVTLLRSVAEIDRLLGDGGYLIIGDFYPSNRLNVPYHHLPDGRVQTYKQNYAEVFLSSGLYHPVCMMTAHHATKQPQPEASEGERTGTWLLRKQLRAHYVNPGANSKND
jgi:SAM-dependent methyltransferase